MIAVSACPAQTVGLIDYDAAGMEGYVLFAPVLNTTTYLIDKCGKAVHSWPSEYRPGQSVYLLDDGRIMRTALEPSGSFNAGGRSGRIERITWDGNVDWSYTINDNSQCSHHDIRPMPNGNVLVVVWQRFSTAEAIANGRNPALVGASLWSEKILELEPVGADQANIVWEWHLWDHLVQQFDATKPHYGPVSEHPELVDLNYVPGNPAADWVHINSVDYNAELDQIMLSAHSMDEIWVIDHSTTTAEASTHVGGASGRGGDLLYRWGNPRVYDRGTASDQVYYGQHNAQWIPADLPRGGDILVFNNGQGRPAGSYSTIDVISPPMDEEGNYTIDGTTAFGPAELGFSWSSSPPTDFVGLLISGAQALPNGGFMACVGPTGTFVEIDANGNEIWRYVNPVNIAGPITQGAVAQGNAVFRCTWIPPEHPGLAGQDLTPGAPIELEPLPSPCITLGMDGPPTGQGEWQVYPQPASNGMSVRGPEPGATLELLDMRGALMGSWTVGTGTLNMDVAAIPNGIYVLSSTHLGIRTIQRIQ
jgi:hypothetical protein